MICFTGSRSVFFSRFFTAVICIYIYIHFRFTSVSVIIYSEWLRKQFCNLCCMFCIYFRCNKSLLKELGLWQWGKNVILILLNSAVCTKFGTERKGMARGWRKLHRNLVISVSHQTLLRYIKKTLLWWSDREGWDGLGVWSGFRGEVSLKGEDRLHHLGLIGMAISNGS